MDLAITAFVSGVLIGALAGLIAHKRSAQKMHGHIASLRNAVAAYRDETTVTQALREQTPC